MKRIVVILILGFIFGMDPGDQSYSMCYLNYNTATKSNEDTKTSFTGYVVDLRDITLVRIKGLRMGWLAGLSFHSKKMSSYELDGVEQDVSETTAENGANSELGIHLQIGKLYIQTLFSNSFASGDLDDVGNYTIMRLRYGVSLGYYF